MTSFGPRTLACRFHKSQRTLTLNWPSTKKRQRPLRRRRASIILKTFKPTQVLARNISRRQLPSSQSCGSARPYWICTWISLPQYLSKSKAGSWTTTSSWRRMLWNRPRHKCWSSSKRLTKESLQISCACSSSGTSVQSKMSLGKSGASSRKLWWPQVAIRRRLLIFDSEFLC